MVQNPCKTRGQDGVGEALGSVPRPLTSRQAREGARLWSRRTEVQGHLRVQWEREASLGDVSKTQKKIKLGEETGLERRQLQGEN